MKKIIHDHCLTLVQQKIRELQKAIASQKDGLEGSSSAGDKHNTEGAMHHLEEEKKQQQLQIALQNQKLLAQINPSKICTQVELGAYVKTNKGHFYFSAPLGKIQLQNTDIMVLSLASPLGRILSKMKPDESVCFNQELWVINGIT